MRRQLRGQPVEVIPSARRLVQSLRDIGYDFVTAVADLVDNSIAAGAGHVAIRLVFDGPDSAVLIEDDGSGMSGTVITEAMRFGSGRSYQQEDLGKFGLGLKTASLSQCQRLTVASRTSTVRRQVEARVLDLEHVENTDRWEVLRVAAADHSPLLTDTLTEGAGTVVLWERLDRILAYNDPWGERANRKLRSLAEDLELHLGMVFHRFLTPPGSRGRQLTMSINGNPIEAWDPFVGSEPATEQLPEREFDIAAGHGRGLVRLRPYVLPPQQRFSSPAAWSRASGPNQWNRQQGFYIYRGDRIIQSGGWSWMRSSDEHNKLARAALEFWPELDSAFEVNVTKTRVKLPDDLRVLLRDPVQDLVRRANTVYRQSTPKPPRPPAPPVPRGGRTGPTAEAGWRGSPPSASAPEPPQKGTRPRADGGAAAGAGHAGPTSPTSPPSASAATTGARHALEEVARAVGEQDALRRIADRLRADHPGVAHDLGWS